jgi:hypothetical protein
MALATKLSEVCDRLKLLLEAQAESLGIADDGVFYGDQERIPVSPAICVEPDLKRVELYGAGRMTKPVLRVYVLVYHSEIRDASSNRRDADKLAESVGDLLNTDGTFFGMAIHCYVSESQSGYATKQNGTLRCTRLTFELTTQERLPNNP